MPKDDFSNARRGDVVTFFRPSSTYNTRGNENLDMKGNPRNCTHAGLLYDFDKHNKPVIIHQYTTFLEAGLLEKREKARSIKAVEIIRANSEI